VLNVPGITQSYATGSFTGFSNTGGLVGYNGNGTMTNCCAAGAVTGTNDVGGFVGFYSGVNSVTACFWLQDTDLNDTGNTGNVNYSYISVTTTAGMQTETTFTGRGRDFAGETANGTDDYWSMDSGINGGFPYFTDMAP
jgi:hypothetical protein